MITSNFKLHFLGTHEVTDLSGQSKEIKRSEDS